MKPKAFFISILGIFLIMGFSCDKESNKIIKDLPGCNLKGNTITVKDKIGTLILSNSLNGVTFPEDALYIKDVDIEGIYLPLKICNLTKQNLPYSLEKNPMKIKFNGNIQLLPETVDAITLNIEITQIETL